MYYPYCTIGEDLEVVHTPLKNGITVEKPDPKYCFKTLDCTVPYYRTSNIVGFTDDEVAKLVDFCMNNAACLIEFAQLGGIKNA